MQGFPILIGIAGVKGSGKDTTADFIEVFNEQYTLRGFDRNATVCRRGFADSVKWAFARQWFPEITMQEAIGWCNFLKNSKTSFAIRMSSGLYENHVDFRNMLARFATEAGRDIYGYDHWLDQLLPINSPMSKYASDPPNMVYLDFRPQKWHDKFQVNGKVADICLITDLRFENERKRICELGGICIKIHRLDAQNAVIEEARRFGREVHRSELGLPDELFDYVIDNSDNNMAMAKQRTYSVMMKILLRKSIEVNG